MIVGSFLRFKSPRHSFGYQWLEKVKINNYAKFEPNIPCSSRVMSILLTDDGQPDLCSANNNTNWHVKQPLLMDEASIKDAVTHASYRQ